MAPVPGVLGSYFGMVKDWYARTVVPKVMLQVRKGRENFGAFRTCAERRYLLFKEAIKLNGNDWLGRFEGFQEAFLHNSPRDGREGDLPGAACVVLLAVRTVVLKSYNLSKSSLVKISASLSILSDASHLVLETCMGYRTTSKKGRQVVVTVWWEMLNLEEIKFSGIWNKHEQV